MKTNNVVTLFDRFQECVKVGKFPAGWKMVHYGIESKNPAMSNNGGDYFFDDFAVFYGDIMVAGISTNSSDFGCCPGCGSFNQDERHENCSFKKMASPDFEEEISFGNYSKAFYNRMRPAFAGEVNRRSEMGYTISDLVCAKCGGVVEYHEAILGQGAANGCKKCQPNNWQFGYFQK